MMIRILYLFLFIQLFQFSASKAQIDPSLAADLQNILDTSLTKYGIEGVESTVILPGDCKWTGVSGIATSPTDPVDTLRRWHWASTTKAMTSALVLQLHDLGLLNINDPIGNYINAGNFPFLDSALTIKRFLNHTTNVTNSWYQGSVLWNDVWSSPCNVWTLDSTLHINYWEPANPVPFDTNQTHKYVAWNNYMILGYLIEEVSGNPLSSEFYNRIFDPLGLFDSYLGINGVNMQNINGSYNGNTNNSLLCKDAYLSTRGAASSLISSSSDVADFMRAFHKDQLVPASLMDEARQKAPGTASFTDTFPCIGVFKMYYGYGTEIIEIVPFGTTDTILLYGHGGLGLGSCQTFHNKDHDITISLTGNDFDYNTAFQTAILFSDLMCHLLNNISPSNCITGTEEIYAKTFNLYPNPGNTELNITFEDHSAINRVELLSQDGRLISEHSDPENKLMIPAEHLSSGVYHIRITGPAGSSVKKWVKY